MRGSDEKQRETIRSQFNRSIAVEQPPLLMGVLGYNLLHMLRQFDLVREEVKGPMEWLIKRLIKVGAKVAHRGRRWYVHVASSFPFAPLYRAVFGRGTMDLVD